MSELLHRNAKARDMQPATTKSAVRPDEMPPFPKERRPMYVTL